MQHPKDVRELWGDWALVRWTVTVAEEAPRFPFGEEAFGRISYLPSGRMWATLMRPDRARVEAEGIHDAPLEAQAAMAAGYVAYGGRYRLEAGPRGAEVVHAVEHSLFPDWVGAELRRQARWARAESGDALLVLEPAARATRSGRPIVTRLTWRRLPGGALEGAEGERE